MEGGVGCNGRGFVSHRRGGGLFPPHPAMVPSLDAKGLGEGQERPEQERDLPNQERLGRQAGKWPGLLGLWEEALLCPACKATRLPGESAPICACCKAVDWLPVSALEPGQLSP